MMMNHHGINRTVGRRKTKNYYDIDSILAEEELIPCKTLFDFSFLSFLDPDHHYHHHHHQLRQQQQQQRNNDETSNQNKKNKSKKFDKSRRHVLSENTRLRIPLWSIEKWTLLGYVAITSLPTVYGRKSRERIIADPYNVTILSSCRTGRYYMTGKLILNLIDISSKKVAQAINKSAQQQHRSGGSGRGSRNVISREAAMQLRGLEKILQESRLLRKTLLSTYTGERLYQTLNMSLHCIDDDVSSYMNKITHIEQRLFHVGAISATSHYNWKVYGRIPQKQQQQQTNTIPPLQQVYNRPTTTTTKVDAWQNNNGNIRRREQGSSHNNHERMKKRRRL